jgi:hypothetical protein
MPKSNSTLRQIVRRQFQGNLIARQDADAIAAQPAGKMGQDHAVVFELYAKEPARKFFQDRAGYFDAVLFAHKPPQIK